MAISDAQSTHNHFYKGQVRQRRPEAWCGQFRHVCGIPLHEERVAVSERGTCRGCLKSPEAAPFDLALRTLVPYHPKWLEWLVMQSGLWLLLGTAASIGFVHTLIGVDHSLPFIVIGKAQRWTYRKVLLITTLCGVGHVLSSVLLGFVGIALGVAVERLEWIEGGRGELSAWLLIGFGIAYASWAFYRYLRSRPHAHSHFHEDSQAHAHEHGHTNEHLHPHKLGRRSLTVWTLFVVFVFGPCEPLIPLLMVPALEYNWGAVALVASVFSLTTIFTMAVVVTIGYFGLRPSFLRLFERHVHIVAGLMIAASGLAIKLFGI